MTEFNSSTKRRANISLATLNDTLDDLLCTIEESFDKLDPKSQERVVSTIDSLLEIANELSNDIDELGNIAHLSYSYSHCSPEETKNVNSFGDYNPDTDSWCG